MIHVCRFRAGQCLETVIHDEVQSKSLTSMLDKETYITQLSAILLAGLLKENYVKKNKKQFGIWMDPHQAIIVSRKGVNTGDFVVLANEKSVVARTFEC